MVTKAFVLGPEFDIFRDDTEETLPGGSFHQDAISDICGCLRVVRDRRGLPWFVGNQTGVFIPRRGDLPAAQPSPDVVVHLTLGPEGRYSIAAKGDGIPAFAASATSPGWRQRSPSVTDRLPRLKRNCAVCAASNSDEAR